jgi:SPP1 family predicted phage head-tail adaptor
MSGAGDLDRRILFQRSTPSANSFNELIESWQTLASVSSAKRDSSAAESYRAQEVGAELSTRFRIRWSPALADLNERDRVVIGSAIYNITGVREIERQRWIEVDAVRRPEISPIVNSP